MSLAVRRHCAPSPYRPGTDAAPRVTDVAPRAQPLLGRHRHRRDRPSRPTETSNIYKLHGRVEAERQANRYWPFSNSDATAAITAAAVALPSATAAAGRNPRPSPRRRPAENATPARPPAGLQSRRRHGDATAAPMAAPASAAAADSHNPGSTGAPPRCSTGIVRSRDMDRPAILTARKWAETREYADRNTRQATFRRRTICNAPVKSLTTHIRCTIRCTNIVLEAVRRRLVSDLPADRWEGRDALLAQVQERPGGSRIALEVVESILRIVEDLGVVNLGLGRYEHVGEMGCSEGAGTPNNASSAARPTFWVVAAGLVLLMASFGRPRALLLSRGMFVRSSGRAGGAARCGTKLFASASPSPFRSVRCVSLRFSLCIIVLWASSHQSPEIHTDSVCAFSHSFTS